MYMHIDQALTDAAYYACTDARKLNMFISVWPPYQDQKIFIVLKQRQFNTLLTSYFITKQILPYQKTFGQNKITENVSLSYCTFYATMTLLK